MPIPVITGEAIRPPEIQGPLDQYAKGVQLKSLLGGQQLQQQQIQEGQESLATRQALRQGYKEAITQDANGQPSIDFDKLSKSLAAAGHGDVVPEIQKSAMAFQEAKGKLLKQSQELQVGSQDMLGHAASAIQAANYDPRVAHTLLDTLPNSPQTQQMRQLIDGDPAQFKKMVDTAKAGSPAQQKQQNEKDVAAIRSGATPIGDAQVQQANAGIAQRWQVLHPGTQPPPAFLLQSGATGNDFKRVDDLMKGTETSEQSLRQQETTNAATAAQRETTNAATAAQRGFTNEMAKQRLSLEQQAAADRQQKNTEGQEEKGRQPVIGVDKDGRSVLVPASDAKDLGLSSVMKADADMVNKSQAARHWLTLADKTGDTPETMGITQLVNKMDKEGKLGTIASRWNEFLAGKVGAGDPEFAALRAKMGLSATKLMQAHVGSRGGAFMLEHFEDLANAKKMDARTLKAGIGSELDYMKDVAMQPTKAGQSSAPAQSSATPPNVAKALANIGPGIHKLSDGSTWMKGTDGSITKQ